MHSCLTFFFRRSDQYLSRGRKPVITFCILLFFLSNINAIYVIPVVMSLGLLWSMLTQPMILIWVHLGISTLPALTDFGKYFFQTQGYLLRPAAIEPSTIISGGFVFCNNLLW